MAKDFTKLAGELLAVIGGEENVASVVYCATRLRFKLKDNAKASAETAKKLVGVITVIEKAGQFQVVIGNTVPELYREIVKLGGLEDRAEEPSATAGGNLVVRLIDTIAGIFPPILGAMCGGGLIKGLIATLSVLNVLTPEMGTYIILNAIGDAVFYYTPVLLGFSAGRKFGGNPYVNALIGAALVHPSIISRAGNLGGGTITFLKLPVILMNYASSVVPIVVASYVACRIEKELRPRIHASVRNFIVPMLCLIITVPLTLLFIGPLCLKFSEMLAYGYHSLHPAAAGVVVGAFWQVLVIFGMHWAFIPLMLNNLATLGFNTFGPMAGAGAMSQTGAAFGVALRMKNNRETRAMTMPTVITGVFGITEPIIYGVTLPRKKPFLMGVIGGACGGGVVGILGGASYNMGALGILSFVNMIHPVTGIGAGFIGGVAGALVAFVVAALLNYFTYVDDTVPSAAGSVASADQLTVAQE